MNSPGLKRHHKKPLHAKFQVTQISSVAVAPLFPFASQWYHVLFDMGEDQLWSGRKSTLLHTLTILCSATKTVLDQTELILPVYVRMAEIFMDFDEIVGYKKLLLRVR